LAVRRDVAGAFRFEDIHVDAPAVDVAHEELAAIFGRPGAAEVTHQAAMGVSAAGAVGFVVARPRVGPLPMQMIGDGLDVVIGVRIEVGAGLAMIAAPLDDVEGMRNDTGLDKCLAVIVEIEAPGIAGPVREDLELVPSRMIAPDAGVYWHAVLVRGAGL